MGESSDHGYNLLLTLVGHPSGRGWGLFRILGDVGMSLLPGRVLSPRLNPAVVHSPKNEPGLSQSWGT